MKYFKFISKVFKEGTPDEYSVEFTAPSNKENSEINYTVYLAKNRFDDYSCVEVQDSSFEELLTLQSEEVEAEKITKTEFEKIKKETWTYERQQEVIELVKKEKIEEVDNNRNAFVYSPISYKGKEFQGDKDSQDLLTKSVVLYSAAGSTPESFGWIAMDNTIVPMTLNDLLELGGLFGDRTNSSYIKARALKNAILNITSVDQFNLIDTTIN